MNSQLSFYALDDLLVASSNDIIKNGFTESKLPPVIKAWVAEKVLSLLPQQFLSQFLKSLLDNRQLNISDHIDETLDNIFDKNCEFHDDTILSVLANPATTASTHAKSWRLVGRIFPSFPVVASGASCAHVAE